MDDLQDKSANAVERRKDGTVKKGSPNPGGQPKWVKEVRDSLRALHPAARERLQHIIESGEDKDANAAIRLVYDFSLPKPKQSHKVTVGGDPLKGVPDDQLVAFVKGEGK